MSISRVSSTTVPALGDERPAAWWRYPIVWMVVGGPLAVVVASLVTAVIAVRGADPVLSHDESGGAQQARQGVDSNTPAMAARNHAATPRN